MAFAGTGFDATLMVSKRAKASLILAFRRSAAMAFGDGEPITRRGSIWIVGMPFPSGSVLAFGLPGRAPQPSPSRRHCRGGYGKKRRQSTGPQSSPGSPARPADRRAWQSTGPAPERSDGKHRAATRHLAPPEGRHIRAARQIDDDRIGGAGARVIAFDRAPQPGRFDPYDRIELRVELGVAPQHLDTDGVGLDAVGLAVQHRFDDEAQERAELWRTAEHVAADHPLKRGPDLVRRHSIADCIGHRHHAGFAALLRRQAPMGSRGPCDVQVMPEAAPRKRLYNALNWPELFTARCRACDRASTARRRGARWRSSTGPTAACTRSRG